MALVLLGPLVWSGCNAEKTQSLRLMNDGVRAYRENNHGAAAELLKRAVDVWPENGDAHYMLGQIYLRKFDSPKEAVTHFDNASKYLPNKAEVWYQRGDALTQLKRHDEALESLNKAIGLKENYGDALYRVAAVYEGKGELIKSAEHYTRSVQSQPRKPFAYYNLGDLYFRNEKYKEAEQVFKNGVENNPDNAELHHGLGLTFLALKRPKEALIEFQEALRLKSTYPSAMYNLGVTYMALGEPARARGYLEKFLQNLPPGDQAARTTAAENLLLKIQEAEQDNP